MTDLQLFAVEEDGQRPLPVPPHAHTFDDLYDGLPLGVYSVLRTFEHNKFLCLGDHIARMVRSMALLDWDYTLDEGRLRRALHALCTAYPHPEMRVRFDVLAAPAAALGTTSRVLVALMPFTGIPPHYYTEGVQVDFAPTLHRDNPLAKTADFALARRAYSVGTADAYERLLLSDDGRILECTGANFYGVRDGVVITAGSGVLEGVTLQIILKLIAELGIPLRREAIPVAQIDTLDEAALSSASRAIMPIVQIGEQMVGDGRPGPVVQRLLAAYNEFVKREVKTAVQNG